MVTGKLVDARERGDVAGRDNEGSRAKAQETGVHQSTVLPGPSAASESKTGSLEAWRENFVPGNKPSEYFMRFTDTWH